MKDQMQVLQLDQIMKRTALQRLTLTELESGRLPDARLGYPDVQALAARYDRLDQAIARDIENGATRHRRLPWLVRQVPRLVTVVDLAVLFTFCAVIFNVSVGDPLATPVPSLAALLLATLAGGVAYTWLAITGDRLRTFRGQLGEIAWNLVGRTSWFMVGVSLVLVAALSVLMFNRVVSEVVSAGDEQISSGAAVPLGVVFAVISAVANLAVVAVHALDGSQLADEHRHAGRVLARHEGRLRKARRALMQLAGGRDAGGQGLSA